MKQIVGGSLSDNGAKTNFESEHDAVHYSHLYRDNHLKGGHVIALGPGNKQQSLAALNAWPNGLQYGGGVNLENALEYLHAGASHVIVTSYLFDEDTLSWQKLEKLSKLVDPCRLVVDLSCRKTQDGWYIATNRWQTTTRTAIDRALLSVLADYCDEFLVHAADVEGLQGGIDEDLVTLLGEHCSRPVTYAGGAKSIADLDLVHGLSDGKVDLTIGSALDIFGGTGATLADCIAWNNRT